MPRAEEKLLLELIRFASEMDKVIFSESLTVSSRQKNMLIVTVLEVLQTQHVEGEEKELPAAAALLTLSSILS